MKKIKQEILDILQPGDLILFTYKCESIVKFIELYLKPTPISHISIYFGNMLHNYLKKVKYNIENNTYEYMIMKKYCNKELFLKNIDKYLNETDNITNYVIEINIKGFSIYNIDKYLNKRVKECYIYSYDIKHIIKYLYLYNLGLKFGIFNYGKEYRYTYCYKSIVQLILLISNDILNISIFNNHYNSLFFTSNKNMKLKLYYKYGRFIR